MTQPKRIIIVGHMGAGKSLLAKTLAAKLGWQYVDANLGLERFIGKSLHEILGTQGEESFHQCEADILTHYSNKEHVVIVLDDAVITTEKNRNMLAQEFVVYLKVSIPVQIERMSDGPSAVFPIADNNAFLDKFHHERDSLFEEVATVTIDSKSKDVDDDVQAVLNKIS
jgi:shikimate kinase